MSTGLRYLCFALGKETFAVPLLHVREVLAPPELTPVPHTPAYFRGIMNLRGRVVSVVDLRGKLGLKAPPSTEESAVIICSVGDLVLGLTVDAVESVVQPAAENISADSASRDYLAGVYAHEKGLVLLLDVARAFGLKEAA